MFSIILQRADKMKLQAEVRSLQSKYKKLKILYNKSVGINLQKDLKIQRLEQELNLAKNGECAQSESKECCRRASSTFGTFSEYFAPDELRNLRVMQNDSRYDATFVRTALLYLYKDNPTSLQYKSVRGAKPKLMKRKDGTVVETEPREPLSPKKLNILKSIYSERISGATSDEIELTVRTNETHFNQLIATSLSNIRRGSAKWIWHFLYICYFVVE